VQTGYANEGFENFNGITLQWDYAFDLPRGLGQFDIALNDFHENHLSQAVGVEDVTVLPGFIGNSRHRGNIDFTWTGNQLYALWQTRYVSRAVYDNALPANDSLFNGVGTWFVNNLRSASRRLTTSSSSWWWITFSTSRRPTPSRLCHRTANSPGSIPACRPITKACSDGISSFQRPINSILFDGHSFPFAGDHLTESSIPLPIGRSAVSISGREATKARYFLASSRTIEGSIMLSAAMIPSSASFG